VFEFKDITMKVFSLFLLFAGWFLVVASIAMLRPGFLAVFAVAGLAVELLGLGLLAWAHMMPSSLARQESRY